MNIGFFGMLIGMIVIVAVAIIYNILTSKRNKVKESFYAVNISLKKRWDLIPSLVEVVKGYSAYEESTLEKLATLRNGQYDKFQMSQKIEVDNNISKVVSKMMAIAENYPDLKANEQYLNLSNQLVSLENEIANEKKEYNEAVRKYNTNVETIPSNVVAILFGFNEEMEM